MEIETLRKWLSERGCHFGTHAHRRGTRTSDDPSRGPGCGAAADWIASPQCGDGSRRLREAGLNTSELPKERP